MNLKFVLEIWTTACNARLIHFCIQRKGKKSPAKYIFCHIWQECHRLGTTFPKSQMIATKGSAICLHVNVNAVSSFTVASFFLAILELGPWRLTTHTEWKRTRYHWMIKRESVVFFFYWCVGFTSMPPRVNITSVWHVGEIGIDLWRRPKIVSCVRSRRCFFFT